MICKHCDKKLTLEFYLRYNCINCSNTLVDVYYQLKNNSNEFATITYVKNYNNIEVNYILHDMCIFNTKIDLYFIINYITDIDPHQFDKTFENVKKLTILN